MATPPKTERSDSQQTPRRLGHRPGTSTSSLGASTLEAPSPPRSLLKMASERVFGEDAVPLGGGLSLSEQARQHQVDRAWGRALKLKVKVAIGGRTVALSGKQVIGLHAHAERAPTRQVAFIDGAGERCVMTSRALGMVKEQIEKKVLASVPAAGGFASHSAAHDHTALSTTIVESVITFLDAHALREAAAAGAFRGKKGQMVGLPSFRELRATHPDWLVDQTLTLHDAVTGRYVSSILAVSHRWEGSERVGPRGEGLPDPEGVQLQAILDHLISNPGIDYLYYDYSCVHPALEASEASSSSDTHSEPPSTAGSGVSRGSLRRSDAGSVAPSVAQSAGTDGEGEAGATEAGGVLATAGEEEAPPIVDAPTAAVLPFLCCSCLLLADAAYSSRFRPQLEAWLSFQTTAAAGIHEDPSHERCTIKLLRDEPPFMETLLRESWRAKEPHQAFETLAGITNGPEEEEDWHAQRQRLTRWQHWLRKFEPQRA